MGWRPGHTTDADPEARPEFDRSMTLGAAARTTETLIVWCRVPTADTKTMLMARSWHGSSVPILRWRNGASAWSVPAAAAGMSQCCLWAAAALATDLGGYDLYMVESAAQREEQPRD